jgi:hypothetical protein
MILISDDQVLIHAQINHAIRDFLAREATDVNSLQSSMKSLVLSRWGKYFEDNYKQSIDRKLNELSSSIMSTALKDDSFLKMLSSHPSSIHAADHGFLHSRDMPVHSASITDIGLEDIQQMYHRYDQVKVRSLCTVFQGSLLNTSLRRDLWMYNLLHQLTKSLTREYSRLSDIKGLTRSLQTSLSTLIERSVRESFNHAFKTSYSLSPAKEDIPAKIESLLRRAGHLVYTSYIFSEQISSRACAIALLLMHQFSPSLSPVSEISLQMFDRLVNEILPSSSSYKEYSIQAVSNRVWLLLRQIDFKLWHFLKDIDTAPSSATNIAETSEPGMEFSSTCSRIIAGWLETGFLGWFREHAALFLLDQFVLIYDANDLMNTRQHLLELASIISTSLLRLLHEPLIVISAEEIPHLLRSFCQGIPTKRIVESVARDIKQHFSR